MNTQPSLTQTEWRLLLHLLEAERANLPVEIHHTGVRAVRDHLKERLQVVDGLLPKLKQVTGTSPDVAAASTN
jgi:hypothetical protein